MPRNILITRRDRMLSAGVTFSGGSWSASAPLANMLDMRPQFVAEAAAAKDPSSSKFDVDLGAIYSVGLFHFQNLRTTRGGTIRLRAGTSADFSTTLYDTGEIASWPKDAAELGTTAWGEFTMTGAYDSDTYGALGLPRYFVPPAVVLIRYIRVEIVDNVMNDPVQIGCFGACEVWEPSRNQQYDWRLMLADESDVQRVSGGSTYVTERRMRRRLEFGINYLTKDEVLHQGLDVILAKGRSRPLVIVPFPDDVENLEKTSVYGLLAADAAISNPFFALYNLPLAIEQLI